MRITSFLICIENEAPLQEMSIILKFGTTKFTPLRQLPCNVTRDIITEIKTVSGSTGDFDIEWTLQTNPLLQQGNIHAKTYIISLKTPGTEKLTALSWRNNPVSHQLYLTWIRSSEICFSVKPAPMTIIMLTKNDNYIPKEKTTQFLC